MLPKNYKERKESNYKNNCLNKVYSCVWLLKNKVPIVCCKKILKNTIAETQVFMHERSLENYRNVLI